MTSSASIEVNGVLIDLSRIHRIDQWLSDGCYPGDNGWTSYYVMNDHDPFSLFLTKDDYDKLKKALKERWVKGD